MKSNNSKSNGLRPTLIRVAVVFSKTTISIVMAVALVVASTAVLIVTIPVELAGLFGKTTILRGSHRPGLSVHLPIHMRKRAA